MRIDLAAKLKSTTDSIPISRPPCNASGRDGEQRWWQVGGDRVELSPAPRGWTARVCRAGWGGIPLDLDGHFGDEAAALAWCERMAQVLASDLEDEQDSGPAA